ncbi:MAG: hypothetical protein K2Y16_04870 [Burkholderiales bacterium]|nr:hypothetical protein [Burkholderiales bacterium]
MTTPQSYIAYAPHGAGLMCALVYFEHGTDDADAAAERGEYEKLGLPPGHVNIRSRRLGGFDRTQPMWIYRSHGFDLDVIDYLRRYWPLDYRRP